MNQTCNGNETIRDPNVTRTLEQVMSLKSKIEEIQNVQRKGEIDLVNHELNSDSSSEDIKDAGSDEDKENADEDGRK